MKKKLLLKLAFLYFHLLTNTKLSHSLTPDGLSLLSLKSAVDQTSAGSAFSDWNEDDPTPCRWTGVWCMNITGLPDPHVVGIAISGKNLRGYIPSELGNLIYLRRLNLHNNNFYGSIPDQLFNATSLHGLFLYGNNLSGSIPPSICNPPRLQNVDLSNNSLSGSLPQNLNSCKQLQRLILAKNKFSASIPAGIWPELDNLVQLDLSDNAFNGSIPNDIVLICEATISAARYLKQGLLQTKDRLLSSITLCFAGFPFINPDDSNGCSCTGERKFGGNETSHMCSLCYCANGLRIEESDLEDQDKVGRGKPEGELVAIDKGFTFELDELLKASAYVLGKSGLGIVYKVVLDNGIPVAVRRLGEGGEQRYKEFVTEAQAIGKVKHPNVVKLRAYYWAPDEKLLISDFISNGNLANALRAVNGIGEDLQSQCDALVHSVPTNSSVREKWTAIKSFMFKQSDQTTTVLQRLVFRVTGRPKNGTCIHLGVVLLELLTGKSPELSPSASTSIEVPDLVKWVRKGFEEENPLSDMVDPLLLQEVHAKKEVIAVFHVALACTEADSEVRPRMKTVSENLERIGT
ncbi:hypothetical protein OIU78_007401 [Salix suchowensis]|nr:hypothetical protein OIU78_007401 [Salix suchowensis]